MKNASRWFHYADILQCKVCKTITQIRLETNSQPYAIILLSYSNYVLVIPDCRTNIEYLPSSERHSHKAHVIVIRRVRKIAKATISFVMSVRQFT
jgi:hypothetical protein